MEYANLKCHFITKNRSGEAYLKIPRDSLKKSIEIEEAGFYFEGEQHPNPAIGITTSITHEELGDLAIVSSSNTLDWRGHAVKVGEMIDGFDIEKHTNLTAE